MRRATFDHERGVDRASTSVTFARASERVEVVVKQDTRARARESDGTARWVWDCAPKTCEYLCARAREIVRGRRVIEIGAGAGMPGLVCAQLGAREVTLTDMESELTLLETNARANDTRECDVRVEALRWGDCEKLLARDSYELVVCSDVVYKQPPETLRALADTVEAACAPNGTVVLAYYFRENLMDDREFFELMDESFEERARVDFTDAPDVWLFELAKRPSRRSRPSVDAEP